MGHALIAVLIQVQKGKGIKYMPGLGPAVPQKCPETGANFLMGGPFWADPIHNMEWVQGVLKHVQVRNVWFLLPAFSSSMGLHTLCTAQCKSLQ